MFFLITHTSTSSIYTLSLHDALPILFKVALDQIESYANLIEAFVECAKYFTELAYDVLVWSLMRSLGGRGDRKSTRLNSSHMSISYAVFCLKKKIVNSLPCRVIMTVN